MDRFHIRNKPDKFIGGVGLVFAAFPDFVEWGVFEQLGRVDLDFVRAEAFPQAGEISPVGFERGAQQVGHPVQDDFESSLHAAGPRRGAPQRRYDRAG